MSPTPAQCSNAVLAMLSLVAPLTWAGDFRPYFTVHDSAHKYFSMLGRSHPSRPVLIGVTNPFFIKAFDHYPHLIALGQPPSTSDSATAATTTKSALVPRRSDTANSNHGKGRGSGARNFLDGVVERTKKSLSHDNLTNLVIGGLRSNHEFEFQQQQREQLMWEYRQQIFSLRHFVVRVDQNIISTWNSRSKISGSTPNCTPSWQQVAATATDDLLLKHFEQLTEKFLRPLQSCFDSLWYSLRSPFASRSEHSRIFSPTVFVNYVKKNGYPQDIFDGKKADVLGLYSKFIRSIHFRVWLGERLREAYHNDVVHADINFMLRNTSHIQKLDLYMRLNQDLSDEEVSLQCNPQVCDRLRSFLSTINESLPVEFRQNLQVGAGSLPPNPTSPGQTDESTQQETEDDFVQITFDTDEDTFGLSQQESNDDSDSIHTSLADKLDNVVAI